MAKEKRMKRPTTLGALMRSHFTEARTARRTVREEMRENLLRMLKAREPLFPGIVGYDETVIPQIVNAILSKHHMILLGLRGQAKSRILRGLTAFLDDEVPSIEGCEIHDNPYAPICAACQQRRATMGEATPTPLKPRGQLTREALATRIATVADLAGEKAETASAGASLDLSSPLTIH